VNPKKVMIFLLISLFLAGTTFSCILFSNTMSVVNASAKAIKAIDSAAQEFKPEQEYYIGRAVAATILTSYKLYTEDQKLTSYLNNICAAITINSSRPNIYNGYHVAMLDSNEINAFATSGGHIFVTRGLVNAAKSEDALAGVIAHEVAHIQLQHSIKVIKNSRTNKALSATGTAVLVTGTAVVGTLASTDVSDLNNFTMAVNESVGEVVQTLVDNGYSQNQEFEADNTAMSLMAGAGYDPSGLIDMLKSLSKVQKKGVGFGKTHPKPAQRITNAKKTVGKYKVVDTSVRNARYASMSK